MVDDVARPSQEATAGSSLTIGQAAFERADWNRVAHVYGQCIATLDDESHQYLPSVLAGFLAEVMARVSASYFGAEEEFARDALAVFCEHDGVTADNTQLERLYRDARYRRLSEYREAVGSVRRRPTPLEAAVETIRRLRDLNAVEVALGDCTTGALLGGSVSYGRFFNVVGADQQSPSDLDLMLVVDRFERLSEIVDALRGVPFTDEADLDLFERRVGEFADGGIADRYSPIVFSAKVGLWSYGVDPLFEGTSIGSSYKLSLHIVLAQTLNKLILTQSPRIYSNEVGATETISDFRETDPARQDHQRSFDGRNLRLNLKAEVVGTSYVRTSHIFYIADDEHRYYPGMFQNLILPQFDVRWGSTALRRSVEVFRWKMVERLRFERQRRPHELLRISLAHTRSEVFAPHTIRGVDSSTLLS